MSDVSQLISDAQQQLDEHKVWLKRQMHDFMIAKEGGEWKLQFRTLIAQVDDIKLRMSKADEGGISALWEYPDELAAWLRSPQAPEPLRKSITEGRSVDMNQPGFTATRLPS